MLKLLEIDQERYRISQLFLKLLALIYFGAFFSLAGQITGLVGTHGILPYAEQLQQIYQEYGYSAYWRVPTLFWLSSEDCALQGAAYAGCGFALLLLLGILPRLSLILLFILYLSLFHAGQTFLNFQWDYLLLESGFLAIFLVNGGSRLVFFLFYWLLFRLRFLSGLSKIQSGDASWLDLTAVQHYLETQPLPHAGAWYFYQLPEWVLKSGTLLTLGIELLVPFFIFMPRRWRIVAAALTIGLQILIIAAGNHNFINLLTIALCVLLLDDRLLPGRAAATQAPRPPMALNLVLAVAAVLIFSSSALLSYRFASGGTLPEFINDYNRMLFQYGLSNVYHVFPTMPTERQELVIEGSADGVAWLPYRFRYKPDHAAAPIRFIVPHQPRLDWMMWFLPTQHESFRPWFERFMLRLWHNEPAVTGLLAENPFSAQAPRYLRVSAYRFYFATPEQRAADGNWWRTEYLGQFPAVKPRKP